jgi:hypothetical protein
MTCRAAGDNPPAPRGPWDKVRRPPRTGLWRARAYAVSYSTALVRWRPSPASCTAMMQRAGVDTVCPARRSAAAAASQQFSTHGESGVTDSVRWPERDAGRPPRERRPPSGDERRDDDPARTHRQAVKSRDYRYDTGQRTAAVCHGAESELLPQSLPRSLQTGGPFPRAPSRGGGSRLGFPVPARARGKMNAMRGNAGHSADHAPPLRCNRRRRRPFAACFATVAHCLAQDVRNMVACTCALKLDSLTCDPRQPGGPPLLRPPRETRRQPLPELQNSRPQNRSAAPHRGPPGADRLTQPAPTD